MILLRMSVARCVSAVRTLIPKEAAISLLLLLWARRRTTSLSRGVSFCSVVPAFLSPFASRNFPKRSSMITIASVEAPRAADIRHRSGAFPREARVGRRFSFQSIVARRITVWERVLSARLSSPQSTRRYFFPGHRAAPRRKAGPRREIPASRSFLQFRGGRGRAAP